MEYLFMNKDTPLLSFTIENDGFEMIREQKRFSDKMPPGFSQMDKWLINRNYAKHKKHLEKYLDEWGMNDTKGFINVTHCLGLNDTLWIKPMGSTLTWDKVSLYRNDFSDICEKTAFETGLNGLHLQTTSPEFVTDGSFKKFWKKENDGIYLYKFGSEGALSVGLEPYSEYYAAQIAKNFRIPIVDYGLAMYNGRICTKCKIFTSEDIGYVPYYKIFGESASDIPIVLSECEKLGLRNKAEFMFLMDSFIFNQDRHLSNFGFLVDNNTFKIIDFAPVFDFNLSMLCYLTDNEIKDISFADQYFKNNGHKLGSDFTPTGITLCQRLNFTDFSQICLTKHERYNFADERFKALSKYFNINKERILYKNPDLYKPGKNISSEQDDYDFTDPGIDITDTL